MTTGTLKTKATKATKAAANVAPSYALIKGVCVSIFERSVNDKKTGGKVSRWAIDVLPLDNLKPLTIWHNVDGRPAPCRVGEQVLILSKHVVGKYASASLSLVTSAA
jgi:hypothetical protein